MGSVRIAWFSPFPPVQTGIAAVSAELVATLAGRGYAIDPYPEAAAHDFPWIQRQRPYDAIVYQFGNSSHHDYAWPYALRYPGLVVLHDTHLHHARAALLLRETRRDDYRREFAWSEPQVNPEAAELAVKGIDSALFYQWPFCRALVETSLVTAVHGDGARRQLVEQLSMSNAPTSKTHADWLDKIVSIRLGHGQLVGAEQDRAARSKIRARHGIPADAIVFGVFGGLTPDKRLAQILAAFRAVMPYAPSAHLLLGGAFAQHADVTTADYADIADRVTLTGYIEDDELTDHVAAVDVSLNLRWPTARETSGPWLRALAAGKPTVIVDLVHLTDVPSLDPRTWQPRPSSLAARPSPVAVAIDILDEDHSLRLAMRRLATDADLRARLGQAGREHWRRAHTVEAMADDYERVLRDLRHRAPAADDTEALTRPAHLRPDGADRLRALLEPFGIENPLCTFS